MCSFIMNILTISGHDLAYPTIAELPFHVQYSDPMQYSEKSGLKLKQKEIFHYKHRAFVKWVQAWLWQL